MKHLCRSIAIAGHTGDESIVRSGLLHEAAEVRIVALGAADRLNLIDRDSLSQFLADPDISVRYRAIELAARSSLGKDVVALLLSSLDEPKLCEVSCFALGELPLEAQTKAEVEVSLSRVAAENDDPLAREAAVAALGSLGCGLAAILAATDDVATVRRRAMLALAPFQGQEVDAALARGLEDRDWQVRQAAEDLAES